MISLIMNYKIVADICCNHINMEKAKSHVVTQGWLMAWPILPPQGKKYGRNSLTLGTLHNVLNPSRQNTATLEY